MIVRRERIERKSEKMNGACPTNKLFLLGWNTRMPGGLGRYYESLRYWSFEGLELSGNASCSFGPRKVPTKYYGTSLPGIQRALALHYSRFSYHITHEVLLCTEGSPI
jgi:hypothetical protein